jgi:hypothetical protein
MGGREKKGKKNELGKCSHGRDLSEIGGGDKKKVRAKTGTRAGEQKNPLA